MPRLPLNCFLLRVPQSPTSCLSVNFRSAAAFYEWSGSSALPLDVEDETIFDATNADDVVLAIFERPSPPPAWQRAVEDLFGVSGLASGVGRSVGAIAFVAVDDPTTQGVRWAAWCFGSGSRALRRAAVDPRFGIVTALNRLATEATGSESALRQLEYRTFGAYSQRTGHRAARDTPLAGFRIDRSTDMVSAVGGRTGGAVPTQIYGSRPLRTRDELSDVADLAQLTRASIAEYRTDAYKGSFGFIDDYVPVEDEATVDQLRAELRNAVVGQTPSTDVFLPDDLVDYEDERILHFILLPGELREKASRVTLTIDVLVPVLGRGGIEALEAELRFCDTDRELLATAPIIDCLSAELELNGQRYLLADGQFFAVDAAFLDQLNADVRSIQHTELDLPCYGGGAEAVWISSVAAGAPDSFVALDAQLIRLTGESPFEAADLVHASGALVHAKRKGRSSALSYLFVQARRSCQLLGQVPAAGEALFAMLDNDASAAAPVARHALSALANRPPGLQVVLAILGDWHLRDAGTLPLLAKVELIDTVRRLEQTGYEPRLALVGLCSRSPDAA